MRIWTLVDTKLVVAIFRIQKMKYFMPDEVFIWFPCDR